MESHYHQQAPVSHHQGGLFRGNATHVTSDTFMDLDKRAEIERKLNGHTLQLGRILMIGAEHNHCEGFKSALQA